MAFNLRDAARMLGSYQHCVTVDEAIQQLENIRVVFGGDTLVMSQSWPVGEFRVYEDKEGEDGPPIVEVVLDMTMPQSGWDRALDKISGVVNVQGTETGRLPSDKEGNDELNS